MPGEDEPLHAFITGLTQDSVARAVAKVICLIHNSIFQLNVFLMFPDQRGDQTGSGSSGVPKRLEANAVERVGASQRYAPRERWPEVFQLRLDCPQVVAVS